MTAPRMAMSAPDLVPDDEAAVVAALRSGVLGLGPRAEEFERRCADVAGVRFGVAVSSGTAGLHLIAVALGLGPGDEVLVPSFTFAATLNAILFVGATPVFVDVEEDTFNIDPAQIAARRTDRTKAVMVVDIFGHPAAWEEIGAAAQGLRLIDDSCEALGARLRGTAAGSFGDAGCFAFYPNKQITTGEGGMIVTDDEDIASLCRSLRNQGRSEMGTWLEHVRLGFNYRLDELSAALGLSQIKRLPSILERRAVVADRYAEILREVPGLRLPIVRPDVELSWFVYVVLLPHEVARDHVIAELANAGIPSRAYFPPLHLQPYVRGRVQPADLPVTESIAERTLAIPFHAKLSREDQERVGETLADAVLSAMSAGA